MERLFFMLELQSSLNDATNGNSWEQGVTKNGKKIDWYRCIYMEAFELIDSYPWKHWKSIDAKVDRENIKIETVDIWHFVLSEAIKEARLKEVDLKTLAENIQSKEYFQNFLKGQKSTIGDIYREVEIVEALITSSILRVDMDKLMERFFDVAKVAKLDFDELYTLYLGKNILNRFRQDYGYKDGTYIKIWNGVEDNVVLREILEREPNIAPNQLYLRLENIYNSLQS
jgi:dimeric dUTPase (all-alpha-NTP-PPase superfamily)